MEEAFGRSRTPHHTNEKLNERKKKMRQTSPNYNIVRLLTFFLFFFDRKHAWRQLQHLALTTLHFMVVAYCLSYLRSPLPGPAYSSCPQRVTARVIPYTYEMTPDAR